jgi:hypothetical protein
MFKIIIEQTICSFATKTYLVTVQWKLLLASTCFAFVVVVTLCLPVATALRPPLFIILVPA